MRSVHRRVFNQADLATKIAESSAPSIKNGKGKSRTFYSMYSRPAFAKSFLSNKKHEAYEAWRPEAFLCSRCFYVVKKIPKIIDFSNLTQTNRDRPLTKIKKKDKPKTRPFFYNSTPSMTPIQ
jgi:hypothetical protein